MQPHEIEARARASGLTISALCARARINYSTFWRWKSERFNPKREAYERVIAVLDDAERAKEAAE